MAHALAIFASLLAATWLWLAVRIINRRETWAICTLTALIAFPVLVVAFGQIAIWLIQFFGDWQ